MEKNLIQGFSQVRSQGNLGSCTAFAATAILEYLRNRTEGWYGKDRKHYSPRFAYFNSKVEDEYQPSILSSSCPIHRTHPRDTARGTCPVWVKETIEKLGVCDEDAWEYKGCGKDHPFAGHPDHFGNKFALRPEDRCFNDARGLLDRYLDRIDVVGYDPAAWAREILNDNPVFVCIFVNDAFKNHSGRLYDDTGAAGGSSHAVVLMGYDSKLPDPKDPNRRVEAFLLRNSWGDSWGARGYTWITRRALEGLIVQGQHAPPLVFRPKSGFRPFPRMDPPTPPNPAPQPMPVPGGRTLPPGPAPLPPGPGPAPAPHHGDFMYQWWLFNDEAEFIRARDDNLSPNSLYSHGIGRKLNGPGAPDDRDFGLRTTQDCTNIDVMIARPENAGKFVGLGACRLVEVPRNMHPAAADGFWKWDSKRIEGTGGPVPIPQPGPGVVDNKKRVRPIQVLPLHSPRTPHPPHDGSGSEPEFRADSIMMAPGERRDASGGIADPNMLQFSVKAAATPAQFAWVCYLMDDKDEVINPKAFNLRVMVAGKKFAYKQGKKDEKKDSLGYRYNVLEVPQSAADHVDVFAVYIDIPADAVQGSYKVTLEASEWPIGTKSADIFNKNLGTMRVIDRNYIRFKIVPPGG
jgi:hypothetical protein